MKTKYFLKDAGGFRKLLVNNITDICMTLDS